MDERTLIAHANATHAARMMDELHAEALRLDALMPYRFTFDADSPHAASNGTLMSYVFPGGYPLFYVTEHGDELCATCAMRAEKESDDPPICADVNWEDAALYCDDCSDRIASAYAEDEANAELTREHDAARAHELATEDDIYFELTGKMFARDARGCAHEHFTYGCDACARVNADN